MPRTDYDEIYDGSGNLVSSIPRVVPDAVIEREQAPAQVRAALTRLTEIAQQADAVAAQGGNVTQAQLKGLFAAVADEARVLRRMILFLAGTD